MSPKPRNRPSPTSSGPVTCSANVIDACQSVSLAKRVPLANCSARAPRGSKGSRCTVTRTAEADTPACRSARRTAPAARVSSLVRSAPPFACSACRPGSIRRRGAAGRASGVALRQRRARCSKRDAMPSSSTRCSSLRITPSSSTQATCENAQATSSGASGQFCGTRTARRRMDMSACSCPTDGMGTMRTRKGLSTSSAPRPTKKRSTDCAQSGNAARRWFAAMSRAASTNLAARSKAHPAYAARASASRCSNTKRWGFAP